jgi:hypothetical protein
MAHPLDAAAGQVAGLIDMRHASRVATALVASGAFTVDMRTPRNQWYRWNSGIPWAKTLVERFDLPLAYVRAEPRKAGGLLVECSPAGGTRAVVVEDVVATGKSTRRAIRALLAESDLRVAGVQSIANWAFPEMRALLAAWQVRAITSYPQVLASALEAGLIDEADLSQLIRLYADPPPPYLADHGRGSVAERESPRSVMTGMAE